MSDDLVKRLRDADENSQQRVLGSRIFCEAAARIEELEAENARLRDCLTGIEEYWNGGNESAVDAAEEMRDRARAALAGKAGQ